jgi:L-asparaginase
MAPLLIITTGGTFDKEYGRGAGVRGLSFGKTSAVVNVLRRVVVPRSWAVKSLLAKDSLDFTDADRQKIAAICARSPCRAIVVIHGTDTMTQTAAAVAKRKLKKTIVFTGAAQPARMRDTDADFNLGFATAAAQIKTAGVYLAMNGALFAWNKVRKNAKTGVFEATER